VVFKNFVRETEEISPFIASEVSWRESLLFKIIICYEKKCSRTHDIYLLLQKLIQTIFFLLFFHFYSH